MATNKALRSTGLKVTQATCR